MQQHVISVHTKNNVQNLKMEGLWINPYEDRIQEQRNTKKRNIKVIIVNELMAKRTIAQLTEVGRKVIYWKKKTKWQLIMASINNNLKVVMGFIATRVQDTAMGEVCPKVV